MRKFLPKFIHIKIKNIYNNQFKTAQSCHIVGSLAIYSLFFLNFLISFSSFFLLHPHQQPFPPALWQPTPLTAAPGSDSLSSSPCPRTLSLSLSSITLSPSFPIFSPASASPPSRFFPFPELSLFPSLPLFLSPVPSPPHALTASPDLSLSGSLYFYNRRSLSPDLPWPLSQPPIFPTALSIPISHPLRR